MKKKTIGLCMSTTISDQLEERAKAMNISTSKFITSILSQWLESGKKLVLTEGEGS